MSLPVDIILLELLAALETRNTAVLQAPPGAGKTTRVPPVLLAAGWRDRRRIIMLEPRRLAARAAAGFMARQLGEPVGARVGYRTRLETRVSRDTRIEVVTEGILTRIIQNDPALDDYAAVVFDEFHERSLHADLGLVLVRESQQALRPDLRLLIMSATLDTAALSRLLDDAPVISSQGREYPVDARYLPPRRDTPLPAHVAATVRRALAEETGSLLVFLPGAGEIRDVARRLADNLPDDVHLAPLHGRLDSADQDTAIAPAPAGRRKVVLATAIAETSLTIEGIRVVIDAGLERAPVFDPNSGMTRLETRRVSRAAARQRKGRAGRLEPGSCWRLWTESEHARLVPFSPPEILHADLAPLVLELARWGARSPSDLTWLDRPPEAHWAQARELLIQLQALDHDGAITPHGRRMQQAGLHPRLAHMLLRGRELGLGRTAADLAALLEEPDILPPGAGTDIGLRLRALHHATAGADRARLSRVKQAARRLRTAEDAAHTADDQAAGRLLALAWPDRIARRRSGPAPRYLLSNGRGAFLPDDDSLVQSEWLVAAALDGRAREARIFLAASLDPRDLEDHAERIEETETTAWDPARGTVTATRQRRLGALILDDTPLPQPAPEIITRGLLDQVRRRGLDSLPCSEPARQWLTRVRRLQALWPEDWPDLSDQTLLETLDQWLGPHLSGINNWTGLQRLDLLPVLETILDYNTGRRLAELLPPSLTVPAGQRIKLDYSVDPGPVLAVKLQSVFGWSETPVLARGRVPVVLHLLSPAGRPLAVTTDLASFWRQTYPQVRKEMRGRYPKHPWPEDPLAAPATRGTRKQGY